ncbi:MAG: exosortase/archaeosortase family protein [Chloroflexi bacterium]|nr:exosortase/archaeosortase family protein [Chloroflexota bacterium]
MSAQEAKPSPWWAWVLGAMLIGLAFYPTVRWLAATWLGNPYYAHGFLVPVISAVLAWRLQKRSAHHPKGGPATGNASVLGMVAMGAGLGLHLASLAQRLLLPSSLAFVAVVAGLVWSLGGFALLRRQAFPLAFLLLMIPQSWLELSTPHLARMVADASAEMARLLGIEVITVGAQIELPTASLTVGAPCSGVNSLAALITLAVLYAYLVRGPALSRWLLAILAAPLALGANLVRVWLIILVAHYAGPELALTLFHDWSSPLLFLLALVLLIATGRGLGCAGIRSDI